MNATARKFERAGAVVDAYVRDAFFVLLITLIMLMRASVVPAGAQSPSIRAGDWLRVDFRAGFQGDVRRSQAPIAKEDSWLDIARRRVGIEGQVRRVFAYQVEYEIGAHQWRDVYIDYRHFKTVQVKAGTFKLPFGLEENTSSTSLDFVYRARVSSRLAPGRDRGIEVHGRLLNGAVGYQAGVFRHDGDNARPSNSQRVFGGRTVAARLVTQPFRRSKSSLAGFQAGGALSVTNVPLGFPAVRARTVFGASFYDSDVWVKGRRQRAGFEARWRPGRLSLQSEYMRLTDERRGQSVEDRDLSPLVASGWYVSVAYALTTRRHRLGGVELAARYESLSFGSGGTSGDMSTSARADAVVGNTHRATTVGANWSVNRWVKVQVNVVREDVRRPSMGPRPEHPVFWGRALRLQLTL